MVQIKFDLKSNEGQESVKTDKPIESESVEIKSDEKEESDSSEKTNAVCKWGKVDTFLLVIALFTLSFGTICAFSFYGRWYSQDDLLSAANFIQTECKVEEVNIVGERKRCSKRKNGEWCDEETARRNLVKTENLVSFIGEGLVTPCMEVKVSFKLIPRHLLKNQMYMDEKELSILRQRVAAISPTPNVVEEQGGFEEDDDEFEEMKSLLHKDFIENENFPECEENFCHENVNKSLEKFETVKKDYEEMQRKHVFVECWYNNEDPGQVFRYPPGLHMLMKETRFRSLWWPMSITSICFILLILRRIYVICCYVCGPDEEEEEKTETTIDNDNDLTSYVPTPETNGLPDVEEKAKYLIFNEDKNCSQLSKCKEASDCDKKTADIYKVEVRPLTAVAPTDVTEINSNI